MLKLELTLRRMFRSLPEPVRMALKRLRDDHDSADISGRQPDAYVISFPKAGRTWLRMMMGAALADYHGIRHGKRPFLYDEKKNLARYPQLPYIVFSHDDDPHRKAPSELATDKSFYAGKDVIFLVRDVRDVVISAYFQATRRAELDGRAPYEGTPSQFIRSDEGSLDSIIRFYNIWAENCHVPEHFLLVRYEDMQQDALSELGRVMAFIGYAAMKERTLRAAVEAGRFDNMQKMEREGWFDNTKLQPGDRSDPASFKVRRGKVGGYVDYLTQDDVTWMNARIRRDLSDYYASYKDNL